MIRDLKGRCTCGAVGYKARGRPDRAYACHCLHCQKRTGSAFALLLPVTAAHFSITGETIAVEQLEANGVLASLHLLGRCLTRLYTLDPI